MRILRPGSDQEHEWTPPARDDRREIKQFAENCSRKWREAVATSLSCSGWSLAMLVNLRIEPYHDWLGVLVESLDKPDLVEQLAAGIPPAIADLDSETDWRLYAIRTLSSRDWSTEMIAGVLGVSKQRVHALLKNVA